MSEHAFPGQPTYRYPGGISEVFGQQGMTKREFFSALAMQGILSSWPKDSRFDPDRTANVAIEFADALIARLEIAPGDEDKR